jgi:hypothetical protein
MVKHFTTNQGIQITQKCLSRLALKIVVMARQEALMQEARVKRFWEILLFFTAFNKILQLFSVISCYLEIKILKLNTV